MKYSAKYQVSPLHFMLYRGESIFFGSWACFLKVLKLFLGNLCRFFLIELTPWCKRQRGVKLLNVIDTEDSWSSSGVKLLSIIDTAEFLMTLQGHSCYLSWPLAAFKGIITVYKIKHTGEIPFRELKKQV